MVAAPVHAQHRSATTREHVVEARPRVTVLFAHMSPQALHILLASACTSSEQGLATR